MLYRFGVFEADTQTGELRKQGLKLKLHDQAFQILVALLEHPGELVSRDDLRQRLWAEDTFVDFDHGLNKSINRLRETLSDSAAAPRYIETLPKRGYRFLASVATGNGAAPAVPPKRRSGLLWAAGACALIAISVVLFWPRTRHIYVTGSQQLTTDGRIKVNSVLVTDGVRLYFNSKLPSHCCVTQIPVTGGASTPFFSTSLDASASRTKVLDYLRSSRELLVTTDSPAEGPPPIWAIPISGGPARRVGNLAGSEAAASPDGRRFVNVGAQKNELEIADIDGTLVEKLPIPKASGYPGFPDWSPDGTRVSFGLADYGSEKSTLWEADLDNKRLRQLFPGFARQDVWSGRWSRDGRWYFYLRGWMTNLNEIWVRNESNGETYAIASGPLNYLALLPNADGTHLYVLGEMMRGELSKVDPATGGLMPFLAGISATDVIYSPDGEWLAYRSFPHNEVWKCRKDGSGSVRLSPEGMSCCAPRWSPDGRTLVFSGVTPDHRRTLYSMPAEGGSPVRLPPENSLPIDSSWSPDGKQIIIDDRTPYERKELRILDTSTGQIAPVPGSKGLVSPRWSPDGRYLLALGQGGVWLFSFANGKWAKVGDKGGDYPLFTPDGRWVYFFSTSDANTIYRFRPDHPVLERVVSLKDQQFSWPYFGMAPDGSLLVMRWFGSQEVYSLDLAER